VEIRRERILGQWVLLGGSLIKGGWEVVVVGGGGGWVSFWSMW
jgi:hypothetical protein